jgi:SWI/SNF-related matrix-associated actin-dependent regulator 1 of chromatin subfamily A
MRLHKVDSDYVLECNFQQKELPKSNGFRWDAKRRFWYTPDPCKAIAFKNFTTDHDLLAELFQAVKDMESAVDCSRAEDADISIPKPDGLEYLPFQKAGIKYCLLKFGRIKDG